jgi:excinuclease UvrABC ATPase subunit
VARHYGFDIETPFETCPSTQQVLLYGSGDEDIEFVYHAEGTRAQAQRQALHPFEGIIPNFERRFRETDSVPPCARTWRATRPPSPAPTAAARACARGAPRVRG